MIEMVIYDAVHFFNFYISQEMRIQTERTSIIDEDRQIKSSQKKFKTMKKMNDFYRPDMINGSSCSIAPSNLKNISNNQQENMQIKQSQIETLGMGYFFDKYLLRDEKQENIKEQMQMVLGRKKNQIQSLKIYRDQLKLISRNNQYSQPIRLSIQSLKQKAEIQEKLVECKLKLQKQLKKSHKQLIDLDEYHKFLMGYMEGSSNFNNNTYIDFSKEEEVMLKNLQQQKQMLVRELADEQRKNAKQIKQIQDEILQYRIMIKDKQEYLRNLKAKICTLYIKLHSRNNSRSGSKSKDRNMSLSIRKFFNQNHNAIKQAYVGNNTFKNYSKQILEKVGADEELVKIKFFFASSGSNEPSNKNRQQLFFQCFYKGREGQIHDDRYQQSRELPANDSNQERNDEEATRDKISSESVEKYQQIYVKHLFSMKFFYKSKIVGVECRIKTDKGNKHINIGNCEPYVEHELLTLVNKKIVTMGSYWHGKQMIGVSVWYSERQRLQPGDQSKKVNQKNNAYDQYYS